MAETITLYRPTGKNELALVDEHRFTIIGLANSDLLRVTFTIRVEAGEETVRLISARKAKGKEKEDYEEARKKFDR